MKKGLKLYYVNPLECGVVAQQRVEMHSWTVVKVEQSRFWGLFGEDRIFYTEEGSDEVKDTSVKQLYNHHVKFITIFKGKAERYLESVHNGDQALSVDCFHSMVKARYSIA